VSVAILAIHRRTRQRIEPPQEVTGVTDRELLEQYVSSGSKEAFAALVRRHTDKVYAACRRQLRDPHLAEDATQATFMVLVRKARRLLPGVVIADWLFWTARHCAQEIRRARGRRARHEREAAMSRPEGPEPIESAAREELRAHLDGALAVLPAGQRQAAVLHYFYGKTQEEIARETGCPRTTVARRLSSALDKLRRALSRRGVTVSAAALTAVLAEEAAATAPAALVASVEAVCLGNAAASSLAAGAAQGAIKGMALVKIKVAAAVLCAAAVAGGGGAATVRALRDQRPPDILKLDPDPQVMKIIDSLEDGCSAYLPPLRTTGDLNEITAKYGMDRVGPNGRDYSIKMAWMPERRRAIYYGTNHWYPHRLNDVWEYDLPSNTWVCLYGPDKSKKDGEADWDDVVLDGEVLRTRRGGPALLANTNWQLTYDPRRRAMLWLCGWRKPPEKVRHRWPGYSAEGKSTKPMWAFYPAERRWEFFRTRRLASTKGQGSSALEYVSHLGTTVWASDRNMWALDSTANTWRALNPTRTGGGRLVPGDPESHDSEAVTVYVPDRQLLVSAGSAGNANEKVNNGRTNVYSFETNTWKKVAEGPDVPAGCTHATSFAYDPVGIVCLLRGPLAGENRGAWALDVESFKWTRLSPKGPPPPAEGKTIGYYDPERNVWVLKSGAKTWVYRYKRRATK
jgi:RNA polymerase sigma factor (sigma-70 family)